MRKVAAVSLAVVALAGSNVFAGLATFSPGAQSVQQGTPAIMDVSLTAQTNAASGFDTADVVLLADAPFNFAYTADFTTKSTGSLGVPFDPALQILNKPNELYVGGNTPVSGGYGASIVLGTLTFDTASLQPGTYEVIVNSDIDGGITSITHQGNGESLTGRGEFTVTAVPEPATLGLMMLGALGLLRRRIAG